MTTADRLAACLDRLPGHRAIGEAMPGGGHAIAILDSDGRRVVSYSDPGWSQAEASNRLADLCEHVADRTLYGAGVRLSAAFRELGRSLLRAFGLRP